MRQASWVAFLLLTVGLLSYEASISQSPSGTSETVVSEDLPPPEGGGDFPPNQKP